VSLKDDNKEYDISKMHYWKLKSLVNYVWVTKVDFLGITPIQLFRPRMLETGSSELFRALFEKHHSCDNTLLDKNMDFIMNNIKKHHSDEENQIDLCVRDVLDDLLIQSGLFRENESHILNSQIQELSGGQQARLLTSYYLTGPEPVILLDEGLERTTSGFEKDIEYTRERLIKFISYVMKNTDKTVFLLVQGGRDEEKQIESELGERYLGTIMVKNGNVAFEI
jgi:hypothetical protein